jgi:hypothetical protein
VHLVYFALVTQKTAAVSKALQLFAPLHKTFVRSVMLIHMFAAK